MKIEAKNGKAYDVAYILPRGNELAISLDSNAALSAVAADFEGLSVIRATEETPNVTHVYEGYTKMMSIIRMTGGSIRVVLARE